MLRRRFAALLLLALPVWGAPGAPPALAGFDRWMERAMRELQVPGAAVGVWRGGEVVLAKGYGIRGVDERKPVTADTLFAVGSVTKSFTALAMAMLVDEGKLDWDRPVRDYLPWFELYDPIATQLATPRDLLAHRTGLPRHDFLRMSTPLERRELVRRLRYLEPSRTFRDAYQYCNLTYVAAGFLAAEVAGTTWEELIRQRIFAPLGMKTSTVAVADSRRAADFAWPHEIGNGAPRQVDFYDYQRFGVGPNGAVNSSAREMLLYLAFYLNGGRVGSRQLVSDRQLAELHRPVIAAEGDATYALGWRLDWYRGHRRLSHGGSITGFTAEVALFRDANLAIVVLNNLASPLPSLAAAHLADLLLGLEPFDHLSRVRRPSATPRPATTRPPAAVRPPPPALDRLAGEYSHPAYGAIRVERSGDRLRCVFPALAVEMVQDSATTFRFGERSPALAQFRLDRAGRPTELLLPLEPAVRPLVFTRVEAKR